MKVRKVARQKTKEGLIREKAEDGSRGQEKQPILSPRESLQGL